MNKNIKLNFKVIGFLFIISFLVIYLFSIGTSPFYGNYYTSDSSIFITVGKAIKDGKILYKEIFDHKGPILFFIQMIGQFICNGRFGIFILEVVSLFITNLFLYKTLIFFTSTKKSLLSICVSMICMSYFIETGNYSEEYSLPFLAICLYLAVKWLNSNNLFSKNSYLYSFIYGICFGIIAFIRLNNAGLICGLSLVITIIFIKQGKIQDLIKCAISLILGILLICIPIFLYFYKVNALIDMLYGTFIHNFLYISSNIQSNMTIIAKVLILFILTLLLFFNCKTYSKNKNYTLFFVCCYLSTLLALIVGPGFNNYYIIAIPLITIMISPVIDAFSSKSMNIIFKLFVISYVCIIYIIGCFVPQLYYKFTFKDTGLENISSFIEKNIPEKGKNSVLAIGLFTAPIYLYGDITPCYKYAFMQDYLFISNKNLMLETLDYIMDRNISYIFCEDLDKITNKNDLQEIILENYKKKDTLTIMEANQLQLKPREIVLYELK